MTNKPFTSGGLLPVILQLLLAIAIFLTPATPPAAGIGRPTHARPYLMPAPERARILDLEAREPWAREELARLAAAAMKDGYSAALLYALKGGTEHLAVARRWLLDYAAKGGDIPMAREKLNDDAFFKGGQPWISPVYYNLDIRPLLAYDWVFPGLTPQERTAIETGILTTARFRMKCMDRWTQTANLVFKPTYMVAVAGLVTQDRELLAWGFERNPGSPIGGYFPVLDRMLDADGPWKEAPIYPVAHRDLALMAVMSRLLKLYDGADRFARPVARGGSPKGLTDYYIDTAYPPEIGADGRRRIRVLTYGDGATSASGDLFLVGAGKGDTSLAEALTESWGASEDSRYAAFLALDPAYRATLPDHPPLPRKAAMPPAPSKVWKSFGLAFLRSDESPQYWDDGRAMAASLLMSRGYGHDHRDKFGITFFGAGRLLYPDWNHEQYENAAVGWTRNTIAHNTLMVDEQDARNAEVTDVRSDFSPSAKLVAVAADGVFEGVYQGRTLVLTKRYLLDVFSARSARPRTYDWLLHGIGRLEPKGEGNFATAAPLGPRYARMKQESSGRTDGTWGRSIVSGGGGVRVQMAAAPGTQVVTGIGYDENAMLVVRRDGVKEAAFVAVHEPFRAGEPPAVRKVSVVAQSAGEMVVRVEGDGWKDEHRIPVVSTPSATAAASTSIDLTAIDLRLFPRDRKPLEFTVVNRSDRAVDGTIDVVLPKGFALQPPVIPVGPVPPGGQAKVSALLSTDNPPSGRSTLPARLRIAGAGAGATVAEAAATAWIGPTLHSDYRTAASPLYRVEAPSLRAGLDMRHGMVRHLTDEDGRDRLGGKPLFTFAAGGKELLSESTVKAFTWPTEAPASLLAEVENAARYRIWFVGDRLAVGMDRDWTRAEKVAFTVPGAWASNGTPRWAGVEEQQGKVAAAELAFPDGSWSLCFAFTPPQKVAFDGAGMRFEIGALNGDTWSAGFCRPGSVKAWRGARP